MKKITVFLQKYFIEEGNTSNIYHHSENALSKHYCLILTSLAVQREFFCRKQFLKNIDGESLERTLNNTYSQDCWQKDCPFVRILSRALWRLVMQLAYISDYPNYIH